MLYPPIDSLLEKIDSKYSLVSVASKRARAMKADHLESLVEDAQSYKNVGKALEEINEGLLEFVVKEE